jgi:hypothetical protein
VDPVGTVYIADAGNGRVRKVTTDGVITTVAGSGSSFPFGDGGRATDVLLNAPVGVAVDAARNLYVAETFPVGVALDRAGNLYIAYFGNDRIRRMATDGTIVTAAGNGNEAGYSGDGGAAVNAELYSPWGVEVDAAGSLFIADARNNRIGRMATDGTVATVAGNCLQWCWRAGDRCLDYILR